MWSNKYKKVFWIAVIFMFVFLPISWGVSEYTYRVLQEDWLEQNMPKIKPGMTYKDVESLLGPPQVFLFSSSEDINKMPRPNNFGFLSREYLRDSKTKRGEVDWLYFYYRDSNPDFPTFSFDVKTGKLIRVNRRPYLE
jgi:hypothetical protein